MSEFSKLQLGLKRAVPHARRMLAGVSLLLLCANLTWVAASSAEPPEPESQFPETTEPQATEPEATEPQATEPEATEPQVAKPQQPRPVQPAASALDQKLLEGLGAGLLEDLPDLGLEEPAGKQPGKGKQPAEGNKPGPPRGEDVEGLAGEDIGQAGESNDPLTRIGQQMRQVENRIGQRDTSQDTRKMQTQIISELEELIKQAQQQQNAQNNSSSKKSPGSQRSKVKQPGQQQAGSKPGDGAGKTSQQPARDSSDRLGPNESREVNMDQMRDLIKDVWGNLPDRMREQMNQDAVEEFLPKYRLRIEEYFRRLAEEPEENR